jgi:2,4-dienoyl-CoA reductase-like NADH-dependent reductase (Old Yellow Enzyme family)
MTALAPSAVSGFTKSAVQEMTPAEIRGVTEAFGNAAQRAWTAGFDGVQLHAAHGYLLSQFLSPVFNRRQDAYGGSPQRRARAVLETVAQVRQRVGATYPVLIKMNCADFLEGGIEVEQAAEAAVWLQEAGIDAIEVSGGTGASGALRPVRTGIATEDAEAYFREAAAVFRRSVSVPLMLVGGIRSFHVAEEIVSGGTADFISMSRPLIREPALINRWQSGDRRKSACQSDNKCFFPIRRGKGVYCVLEKSASDTAEPGPPD